MQALSLKALIDDRVAKGFVLQWRRLILLEGYVGMAIVGSAVVGFIAAAAMWARRR